MFLVYLLLLIVGFFFPPAWLVLAGIGIYRFASRRSRRDEAVEERVRRMVGARRAYADFPELYFEAARAYAIAKGGSASSEDDAASVTMVVDGRPYFVVFTKDHPGGGTLIGISDYDRFRDEVERFAKGEGSLEEEAAALFEPFKA